MQGEMVGLEGHTRVLDGGDGFLTARVREELKEGRAEIV